MLFGTLALSGCPSADGGGTGSGGAIGSGGAGTGPNGTGGGVGSGGAGSGGSVGTGGGVGSGGSTSTGGRLGSGGSATTGGATGSGGSSPTGGSAGATSDRGGAGGTTTGSGGSAAGGRGGPAGGAGGRGGSAAAGGAGGVASCAGHAVSFGANVPGGNDAAMARVNVPSNADLPIGNASRTVELWAYVLATSWSADTNTVFFYGTNNRNNDGFGLDFGTTSGGVGTIDPFTNGSTDPMGDNKSSGIQVSKNEWVHFAMTWDGTSLKAFVNGVEKVSVSISSTLHTGASALTIGGYPPAFFNGQIDELRIWSVARTANEIASTMNKPLAGNEANLVGYWKFDETSGTTASDSVTAAGHTSRAGTLMANSTANLPTFVTSTAPINCP